MDGRLYSRYRQTTTQRRTIGISQQYQFGRNAWSIRMWPWVAASWSTRRTERHDPVFDFYDPSGLAGELIEPARTEGPTRVTTFRPHISAGFKPYVIQRAFVRSDVRMSGTTGRGVDEVLARTGFEIDF